MKSNHFLAKLHPIQELFQTNMNGSKVKVGKTLRTVHSGQYITEMTDTERKGFLWTTRQKFSFYQGVRNCQLSND